MKQQRVLLLPGWDPSTPQGYLAPTPSAFYVSLTVYQYPLIHLGGEGQCGANLLV